MYRAPARLVARLLCVLAIFSVWPAKAQRAELWAAVGNWSIRIGLQPFAQAEECYLITRTQDGSLFRLGFSGRGVYIAIGNRAWQSLRIGGTYDLSMRFSGDKPWSLRAQVLARIDVGKILLVHFAEEPASQLLRQLTTQPNVVFYYKDRPVASVPLAASQAAAQSLFDCEGTFAPPIR